MSIRNLKDNSKKPWLCEYYPQGRNGKRIRKKFATKNIGQPYIFIRTIRKLFSPCLSIKEANKNNSSTTRGW